MDRAWRPQKQRGGGCRWVWVHGEVAVLGTLCWKIPWTEKPGELQSIGSQLSNWTTWKWWWQWQQELLLFSPSCVRLSVTPWSAARQASLSFTISRSLPKFMSIALVMTPIQLILWRPLLLPSIFPSIRDFSNESTVCIRWPKYWSFSFSISPSNENSGLISFRIDWFDCLAVQGTFRSFPQHHSSKASILWRSALDK